MNDLKYHVKIGVDNNGIDVYSALVVGNSHPLISSRSGVGTQMSYLRALEAQHILKQGCAVTYVDPKSSVDKNLERLWGHTDRKDDLLLINFPAGI